MGKEKTLVEVTVQQGVATVLLNDPEKRNALSIPMADALTAAFAEYSGKVVKRQSQEKPSVRRQLTQLQEVVRKMAQSLSRNKQQEVTR